MRNYVKNFFKLRDWHQPHVESKLVLINKRMYVSFLISIFCVVFNTITYFIYDIDVFYFFCLLVMLFITLLYTIYSIRSKNKMKEFNLYMFNLQMLKIEYYVITTVSIEFFYITMGI